MRQREQQHHSPRTKGRLKMSTYKGPFSKDDAECNTGVGLDRDSYNPGKTPNKYVSNTKGKNSIDLSRALDSQTYDDIGTEGDGLKGGGFSGPVSRNRK
jgi:hypothetical protein